MTQLPRISSSPGAPRGTISPVCGSTTFACVYTCTVSSLYHGWTLQRGAERAYLGVVHDTSNSIHLELVAVSWISQKRDGAVLSTSITYLSKQDGHVFFHGGGITASRLLCLKMDRTGGRSPLSRSCSCLFSVFSQPQGGTENPPLNLTHGKTGTRMPQMMVQHRTQFIMS